MNILEKALVVNENITFHKLMEIDDSADFNRIDEASRRSGFSSQTETETISAPDLFTTSSAPFEIDLMELTSPGVTSPCNSPRVDMDPLNALKYPSESSNAKKISSIPNKERDEGQETAFVEISLIDLI